jgi:dUTP pyrophosphatase
MTLFIDYTGPAPTKGREGDAGWDVAIQGGPYIFEPFEMRKLPTGLAFALPTGWCAVFYPRSGSINERWHVAGCIDENYRGEMFALVTNLRPERAIVVPRRRLGQLLILPVPEVVWRPVTKLPPSNRGALGFGSSGI